MNSAILYKYFNDEATEEEVAVIFEWVEQNPQNKKEFINLKTAWAISAQEHLSAQEITRQQSSLKLSKSAFKPWRYAAILIVLISIGFGWYLSQSPSAQRVPNAVVLDINHEDQHILPAQGSKQITSKNGVPLAEVTEDQITFIEQPDTVKITQQFIEVPYGKTYRVKLSDGSLVYLNAGSSLQFPNKFDGGTREVFLTGEGFFDISKNAAKPFIVHAKTMNVQVLGTRFNVQAYAEDQTIETALEAGSVKITIEGSNSEHLTLIPGELATYTLKNQKLVKSKAHLAQQTAWIREELLLDDTPSAEIFKTLERHYNIKIRNEYTALARQSFSGTVKLNADLQEILNLLQLDTSFDFTIEDGTVTITKPTITH